NTWRRFLLCECVQAYLPLEEPQQIEFERLLDTEPYQGVKAMATTWYEQGLEKGKEHMVQLLLSQLEERFGLLPPQVRERLSSWQLERLTGLGRALLRAGSLQELGLAD